MNFTSRRGESSGCPPPARAIAGDLTAGHDVFARFTAGREGTLWYYRELLRIFAARLGEAHPLVRELESAVAKMR